MIKIVYQKQEQFLQVIPENFPELQSFIKKSFHNLPEQFVLYYFDFENDKINVKTIEDFNLFIIEQNERNKLLELIIGQQNEKNLNFQYDIIHKEEEEKYDDALQQQNSSIEKSEEQKKGIPKIIHEYTTCDGCSMFPIIGIRYKCSECPDFDYCEQCEATKLHPHPFIKIRFPQQDKQQAEKQKYMNDLEEQKLNESIGNQSFFDKFKVEIKSTVRQGVNKISNFFSKKKNYDFEIIGEPIIQPEIITTLTKEIYIKLTLKNTGICSFPRNFFVYSDSNAFQPVKIPQLSPDKQGTITLILYNKKKVGKLSYSLYFNYEENNEKITIKIKEIIFDVKDAMNKLEMEQQVQEIYEKASKLEQLKGEKFEQCVEFVKLNSQLKMHELAEKYLK